MAKHAHSIPAPASEAHSPATGTIDRLAYLGRLHARLWRLHEELDTASDRADAASAARDCHLTAVGAWEDACEVEASHARVVSDEGGAYLAALIVSAADMIAAETGHEPRDLHLHAEARRIERMAQALLAWLDDATAPSIHRHLAGHDYQREVADLMGGFSPDSGRVRLTEAA